MSTQAPVRRHWTRRARFEHLESRLFLSATRAVQAVNSFGVDLYAQLQHEQGNLFFSPLSVATALAMTYAGAAGQTAAEMEQVLHLGTEPGIHESFAALLSSLTDSTAADDGFRLEIANAIWPQSGFPIHDDFIHTIETDYHGATQSLDYSNLDQAKQIINSWVEDKTHGKLKDLLKYLDPFTVMVLTNSIYFKAGWTTAFDPDLTIPNGEFFRENGEAVEVPMMYTPMELPEYTYLDGFQVLEMPLEGGRTSMVFALPEDPATTPNELTRELLVQINDWLESPREPRRMEVWLPKFNTTVSTQLQELLADMGMPLAFDRSNADFSKMTPEQVFISQVRHKAFVEMNEQGTEASAATVVEQSAACFAAGTLVLTPGGEKPIEQLKAGEYVLSRNENDVAGKIEPKRVEATFQGHAELVNLHIGGHTIRATKEHRFYVQGQGWTSAGELRAGDLLAADQGSCMKVERVAASGELAPVYNFRVADHHTYFVGGNAWGFAVWTHNACRPEFRADHPFQFFIRDNATSAYLFMGRIDDPSQSENELVPNSLSTNPPALPGDYNLDRAVDAADYALWRATLGETVSAFSRADGSGNGLVDQSDYQVWRSNFGRTLPAPAPAVAAAMPNESAASPLASDAWFGLFAVERQSRSAASAISPGSAAVPMYPSGTVDLLLVLDGAFSNDDYMLGTDSLDVAFSAEDDEADLSDPPAVTLASL